MTTRALRAGSTGYLAIAAAILVVAAFALGIYAILQLQGMASDLRRVDSRLSALQAVDHKLDGLRHISGQLDQTNTSLLKTNHLLVNTNAKLGSTNSKLSSTEHSIRSLSSIRGDIHEMSRKISGSFLFRGVR